MKLCLAQFRRIVSSASWVPEIDGLRFVAIAAVVLFHMVGDLHHLHGHLPLTSWSERVLGNGDRGVELFFVLSGWVLARPFLLAARGERAPVSLRYYFIRRVTRLEPPYLLSLLLYAVAVHYALHFSWARLGKHLAAGAVYLQWLFFGADTEPNFVTWTLEVEAQFYLLAPLLARVFRIEASHRRWTLLALLTLGGCALATVLHPVLPLLIFAGYLPAGFLVADLLCVQQPPSRSLRWDLLALCLWALVFLLPHVEVVRYWLPVVLVPLFVATMHGRLSRSFLSLPLLTTVGGMCYSIYLLHPLLLSVGLRAVRYLPWDGRLGDLLLQLGLLSTFVLLISAAYFRLIERPCMDPAWPRRLALSLQQRGRISARTDA